MPVCSWITLSTTNPIVLIFQILGNADYVFTSIFTLEIILKVTNLSNTLVFLSFSLFFSLSFFLCFTLFFYSFLNPVIIATQRVIYLLILMLC